MKTLTTIVVAMMLLAGIACAAAIDGKWVSERKMPNSDVTMKIVFDLKSDGAALTGSMVMNTPNGERKSDITEGKLDGNKFSFKITTERNGNKMTTVYQGTVDGAALKGTSTREGGDPREFTAAKQ